MKLSYFTGLPTHCRSHRPICSSGQWVKASRSDGQLSRSRATAVKSCGATTWRAVSLHSDRRRNGASAFSLFRRLVFCSFDAPRRRLPSVARVGNAAAYFHMTV